MLTPARSATAFVVTASRPCWTRMRAAASIIASTSARERSCCGIFRANDFVSAATNFDSFQTTLTGPATIARAIWMHVPTRRIGILRLTQIGRTALAKRRTNCRRRPLWRLRALAGYSKPVDFCGADAVALADYRQPDKCHIAEKFPLTGSLKGIVAMDSVDCS